MSNLGLSLLLLGPVLFFLIARRVYPAKNKLGTQFSGASLGASEPELLEVATFNVQTGKNDQGHRDISCSASVIANVTIAGVQEVYGAGWLNKLGFGKSQTEALAGFGGFSYLFSATRYRWFREQRG